jgi:hypothetical protein
MQTSSVFALKEVLSEKKIYSVFVLKEGLSEQRERNASLLVIQLLVSLRVFESVISYR